LKSEWRIKQCIASSTSTIRMMHQNRPFWKS